MDSNGQPVDNEFYQKFWRLQQVFQRPEEHMEAGPWAAAVLAIAEALQHFSAHDASPGDPAPQADGAPPCLLKCNASKTGLDTLQRPHVFL